VIPITKPGALNTSAVNEKNGQCNYQIYLKIALSFFEFRAVTCEGSESVPGQ